MDEINARGSRTITAELRPPYEFPDVAIADPWGNIMVFEGQNVAVETARQASVRPKMREYVQQQLELGEEFPTPEELRNAVGPPLGTAIEVLNEFEGYAAAFLARRGADDPGGT